MIRPLPACVVVFGALVLAGGVIGFTKGSVASLLTAGPLGLATIAFGVLMARGVPWARRAAVLSSAAVAVVMLERLVETGKAMPAVPVAGVGLVLAFVLFRGMRRPA